MWKICVCVCVRVCVCGGVILASPWLTLVHPFSLAPPRMSLLLNMCAAVSWQVFVWVCVVCACIRAVGHRSVFIFQLVFPPEDNEVARNYRIYKDSDYFFSSNFTYNQRCSKPDMKVVKSDWVCTMEQVWTTVEDERVQIKAVSFWPWHHSKPVILCLNVLPFYVSPLLVIEFVVAGFLYQLVDLCKIAPQVFLQQQRWTEFQPVY